MSDDMLKAAILAGAVIALRKRAAVQRAKAKEGTTPVGDRHPSVVVRSPEAAMADNIADGLERIADEIEAEGRQ